jgi:D-lyxose ketol-isomerase
MISEHDVQMARKSAEVILRRSGVVVREDEYARIQVVDFGLGNIRREGLQLLTMYETGRMAGRILIMTPGQTEPEHWHPSFGDNPGKQEVIRALWGEVRFYLPGKDTLKEGFLVPGKEHLYTMRNEHVLRPGDVLVFEPGTKHWFQAGERGAVFYSFSTLVKDRADGFTDPEVRR